MEKSSEYLKMSDRFNLSHRFASYVIETSIEMDRPDIVYKAQQIHGLSYVRAGYIKPEALTEDGRVVKVSRAPWKLVRRRITPNIFRYHKITQFCCSKLLRIGSPASQKE